MHEKKPTPRGNYRILVMALAIFTLVTPVVCWAGEITVEIAPATLNLKSNGTVVTVHTDIAYGLVDVATVYLQGVAINSWKADDRGYFVAKFLMDEIKTVDGLVIDGYNTLQFVALTIDDEGIWGQSDVMVIDAGTGGNAK